MGRQTQYKLNTLKMSKILDQRLSSESVISIKKVVARIKLQLLLSFQLFNDKVGQQKQSNVFLAKFKLLLDKNTPSKFSKKRKINKKRFERNQIYLDG